MRIIDWSSDVCSSDLPLVCAVDADVDYRRARLDPLPLDELRHADGGDDDIGAVNYARKIASARMRDRDGAAFLDQQRGHRLADAVRSPDDDRILAREIAEPALEQHGRQSTRLQSR